MRVCQITSKHSRYDQRVFKKMATSFVGEANESFLLCADNQPQEINEGVNISSIRTVKENYFNRFFINAFGWKRFKKESLKINADIYQLHDPDLLKLGAFLKRKGKKVIFDSHENYENVVEKTWIPKLLRKPIQKKYLKIEKKVLSTIDGVITVTPFIKRRLEKININTIVIANYPILKSEKKHIFSNFDFCFGGNYGSYNHKLFLEAIDSFQGKVKYNLVLNCSDKELKEISHTKGWNYVNFHRGPILYNDLEKIYDKSAIGMVVLNYSINYNFKEGSYGVIKIFEMMSKGMPIICTDFDVWKSIIKKYKCGVCVNPNSKEEIIGAIKMFVDNPSLLQEYGTNARRAIEDEFNWQMEKNKLLEFYKRINDLDVNIEVVK